MGLCDVDGTCKELTVMDGGRVDGGTRETPGMDRASADAGVDGGDGRSHADSASELTSVT